MSGLNNRLKGFRRIYIPEPLVTILLWHRQHSVFTESDDFVFCGEDGSALNHDSLRRTVLYKVMDRAGIQREKFNHGFHIFRHSAITMLYRLTEDLKRAQGFARHSRISTTADTYVHSDPVESESTEMVAANITSADLLNGESVVHLWYRPASWCNKEGQPSSEGRPYVV